VTFRRATRAGLALLLLLALPFGVSAAGLTGAEVRGKRIYTEGKGRKKITAFLPGAGIRAPGAGFPCVNCHLAGGAGQSEGGVRSADITWFTLTKEYGGPRPSGRAHPPYSDETVRKAITGGLDPAGNVLSSAHPRFGMDREDLDDLLAYIKVMDSEPVPGVTDDAVRVGILFPATGPLAEGAREVRALLLGYAAETNARGGVYNRRLELVGIPFDPSAEGASLAAARAAVESGEVFCFLANIGVPADGEAARFLAAERVPVLVPLLSAPAGGYGADRYTFHVLASIKDQARVLVDFLSESLNRPANRLGILYAKDASGEKGAEGVREQAEKHCLRVAAELSFVPGAFDAAGAVRLLGGGKVDAVLYFGGPSEALAFAREAAEEKNGAPFLAPATMVGDALRAAPPGFLRRVHLAAPLAPPDERSAGMANLRRLREKYSVGDRHRSFQLLAHAGTVLLEEGLRRSGKGVTREKLVGAIGNAWKLQTGVTPPLTYSANRRTGAPGAAIVRVDPDTGRFVTVAEWREPR
jgi:ABC-type branched-subunit amino acid transport system substrate-binding protein